mgnify:CR=1 FL=1
MYAERFAHFFSKDFLVRKAFEALNSESKPEHAGFRRATETLEDLYRGAAGVRRRLPSSRAP